MPRNRACVGVVLSSSHEAHYAFAARGIYERAVAPAAWVALRFYDEHTATELLDDLADNQLDGIMFASGSLQSSSLRTLVTSSASADLLASAYNEGVGFAFLHQLLPPEAEATVDLFGSELAFTVKRSESFALEGPIITDGMRLKLQPIDSPDYRADELAIDSAGNHPRSWQCYEYSSPDQWRGRVWQSNREHDWLLATAIGVGPPIITSSMALDWNGHLDTLGALLARTARARGTIVRSSRRGSTDPLLQSYLASSRFERGYCYRHEGAGPYETFFFANEVVAPELPLHQIGADERSRIRKQLERGGMIAGFIEGMAWDSADGSPVLLELEGPLNYSARAQWFAQWLLPRRSQLRSGFTFDIRGLAVVAREIDDAFEDSMAIPAGLRMDDLRPQIVEAIEHRLDGGACVDDLLVPTAACASALLEMDEAERAAPLVEWLSNLLDDPRRPRRWLEDEHELAEARVRIWVPPLADHDKMEQWYVRNHENRHVPGYLVRLYSAVLEADPYDGFRDDGVEELLKDIADTTLAPAVRGELARILVKGLPDDRVTSAAVAAHHLSGLLLDNAAATGGIEAISMATAGLVAIDARLPLQIRRRTLVSEVDSSVRTDPILLTMEHELAQTRGALARSDSRADQLVQNANRNRRASLYWMALFAAAFFLLDVACVVAVIALEWADPEVAFAVGVPALSLLLLSATFAERFGRLPADALEIESENG